MEEHIIEIEDLHKSFKGNLGIRTYHVLKGVTMKVPDKSIYGFLGPNGAGKTTTIKTLCGLIFPDKGTIKILGKKVDDISIRWNFGYLPESPYFYDYLSGFELLSYFAGLFNIPRSKAIKRIEYLLDLVGLTHAKKKRLRSYSKGMLQRVGLAQALLNDPKLLILDEPLTGLDPVGRREIRDIIISLRDEGKTIFFSSHILADAEMICDRVAIIVDGKVTGEGKISELLSSKILYYDIELSDFNKVNQPASIHIVSSEPNHFWIRVNNEVERDDVIKQAVNSGSRVLSVIPHRVSLEDIFMSSVQAKRDE